MWSRVKLRLADSHAARRWALAAPADNHRGGRCELAREGADAAQWSDYWTLEPLDALGTFRVRASVGGGYLAARPAKSKEEALPDGTAARVVPKKDDPHARWRLKPAGVDGLFTLEALPPPDRVAARKKKRSKLKKAPKPPPAFLDVRALRQTTGLDSLLVRPSAAPARWQLVLHAPFAAPAAAPPPSPEPAAPSPALGDALKRSKKQAAFWKTKYEDVLAQLEERDEEAERARRRPLPLAPRSPDLREDSQGAPARRRPNVADARFLGRSISPAGGKLTKPPWTKSNPKPAGRHRGHYGLAT